MLGSNHSASFALFVLSLMALHTNSSSYCPPGFVQNKTVENSTSAPSCVCMKNTEGIIDCDETSGVARLAIGYCMSFDPTTNSTSIGSCPFNSNYTLTDLGTVSLYVTLPENVSDLNDFLCGQYNRAGKFCTYCEQGTRSVMTSYSLECIPCGEEHIRLGRVTYVALQILCISIIFVVIVVFDIRLTKCPWNVFILFSHVVVTMLNHDRHLYSGLLYVTSGNNFTPFLVKLFLAFYGFWNLDFLPNVLPPFCLDLWKEANHVISYEYFVAAYPLVLIALIYFCVHLYSRDVKCMVVLWRAVKRCMDYRVCCGLKYLLHKVSSQSIAHSFSSFLVLTFPKFLFVSLEIILHILTYDLRGNLTINNEELPFLICALFILITFTILPTLLVTVYPLCVAKWCKMPLSVRLFVESFNGWFNDGTREGTRDFRTLAGLHLILRIMLAISIGLNVALIRPLSPLAYHQWLIPGLVFLSCSVLFALARPYKLSYMNKYESATYALLGTISLLVSNRLGLYFVASLGTIPQLIFMGYIAQKTFKKIKKLCHFRRRQTYDREISLECAEEFNADRLENPDKYHEYSQEDIQPAVTEPSPVGTYGTF